MSTQVTVKDGRLAVEGLVKTFKSSKGEAEDVVRAVDDVSLSVEPGRLLTLLGPSGCGKTTTLRCVAGLEHPNQGEIAVGERVLFSSSKGVRLPANQRGLGMVFQSYAIWPHMNVRKNVSFPLRARRGKDRLSRKEITERADRALAVVQLDHLATRPATDLSGGQQQRLALARALVMQPPLLLLDEPLSNLDAKLREDMRFELKRLQRDLGVTTVYVTHDQVEALAMSDVIAVMSNGKVEQMGRPTDIYNNPRSRFVADFVGTTNLIAGEVESREGDRYVVTTPQGRLAARSPGDLATGAQVIVSVRPEHIQVAEGEASTSAPGVWNGTIANRAFLGDAVDHLVSVGDFTVRTRCNPSIRFSRDSAVHLTFPSEHCSLLPA
ncbi:ABC transporter ATP-binding protein [Asanoa iriomotensis]|uniref:ABC transporter ATP-binding protein n=1 Tax=Asanoa iriomotensis TaxID=234613 RepID=A0ABQ4C3S6_9ACTN|nr:ABC transporter ATP-binding protein [Asanoa iriomotensis]GIF57404.1 ABC transporter ATP-binding protein [Asanoa iriomotensis]